MTAAPVLDFGAIAPLALVAGGAMLVLVGEVFLTGRPTFVGRPVSESFIGVLLAIVSSFFLLLALIVTWQAFLQGGQTVFNPARPLIVLDRLATFAMALILLASLLSCLLSVAYLAELRINHGEYYALLLLATSGMLLLVSATDLIMVFLGLEIMSIPIYVLAGFDRRRLRSNESALKYFLVGSFASAILLYGMALLYGATGHTDFDGLRTALVGAETSRLALVGLGLLVVGFTFKISSVPFHQWTPDVYEGAPVSVTAYMSVTVKVAAFVALLRILASAFGELEAPLGDIFWYLAAATMVLGNFMAVIQDNVKRMLAYSSIAHAGYLLIGFVAGTAEAHAAVLFYLLVYVFMNLGAFGVIVSLAHRGQECDRIQDFGMAALMTLFMIALAGIPGTGGFIAKFTIFAAAVEEGLVGLTVLGVLTSVVSVYYYLRLPVVMYMNEPGEAGHRPDTGSFEWTVLAVCAVSVVVLGIFPNDGPTALLSWVNALDWSRASVALLP